MATKCPCPNIYKKRSFWDGHAYAVKKNANMAFHYLIDSTKGLNTGNIYWKYIPEFSEQNQAWPSNVLNITATSQKPSKTFNGEIIN
jgi:hypothetical protein